MRYIVLDLDHTVVHATSSCTNSSYSHFVAEFKNASPVVVHIRPYVVEFFRFVSATPGLEMVVWTAGTSEYAHIVVNELLRRAGVGRVAAILSRKSATRRPNGVYVKNLDVVRRMFDTPYVVLVDDDPVHATCRKNRGCIVPAPRFDVKAIGPKDKFFERLKEELTFRMEPYSAASCAQTV